MSESGNMKASRLSMPNTRILRSITTTNEQMEAEEDDIFKR